MGWLFLITGITINIAGVLGIKFAQQLGNNWLSTLGYLAYFVGFFVISMSFKHLSIALAYALWSGLGCLLVIAAGVSFFNESLSITKAIFFTIVVIGVVGMSASG